MMLSWRGHGLLGLVPPLACCLLAIAVLGDMQAPGFVHLFWGLMAPACIALWLAGRHLDADADAGEEPHRFMGLPLQRAPPIYLGLFALWLVA